MTGLDSSHVLEAAAVPTAGPRCARLAAVGTIVVALLGLVGHLPGLDLLGRFGAAYIPMAPSTAVCFILLGVAVIVLDARPPTRLRVASALVGMVVLFSALEVLSAVTPLDLDLEDGLLPAAGTLGGVPVGRMSPATAALFALSGLSLALLLPARRGDRRSDSAGVLAGIVVVSGATVILGYLYGQPLLYDTGTIPVAATTAMGFVLLGVGSVAAAGRRSLPLRLFAGDETRSRLLRAFLPLTVTGVLLDGLVGRYVPDLAGGSHAIVAAISAILIALFTAAVVARVAGSVGDAIDRAEAERREAERARASLEEELHNARRLEAVGRLAGGVAHDFNNLLTGVIGYSELIMDSLPPEHPARADVDEIHRAGRRAAELTSQLLAFGRKQVIRPEVVRLDRLVEGIASGLRGQLGDDIELVVASDGAIAPVAADPAQVEQILMRLVMNARDAMPAGGRVTIETRMTARSGSGGESDGEAAPVELVTLSVTDEGRGMDDETVRHLFEPFFTTKPVGTGTGLGLASVYGVVKQSRWEIDVQTEPGRGATFTVTIPALAEAPQPGSPESGLQPVHGTGTILVVEDDAVVRRLVQRTLERAGYRVLVAESGAEAVELASVHAGSLDAMISDVVMPGMSGPEVRDAIEALAPGLPVLFMSGYSAEEISEQGVLRPATVLLEKPFTADALQAALSAVMGASPAP